eukprot:258248_1
MSNHALFVQNNIFEQKEPQPAPSLQTNATRAFVTALLNPLGALQEAPVHAPVVAENPPSADKKKCPFQGCNKLIKKSHIAAHIRRHTNGQVKKYKCYLCDKAFKRKSHLAEHTQTHLSTYAFHCPFCGKGKRTNSQMKRHLRKRHNL